MNWRHDGRDHHLRQCRSFQRQRQLGWTAVGRLHQGRSIVLDVFVAGGQVMQCNDIGQSQDDQQADPAEVSPHKADLQRPGEADLLHLPSRNVYAELNAEFPLLGPYPG